MMQGLGQYLKGVETRERLNQGENYPYPPRSAQLLAKSVVIYCLVHFWRGILEILGSMCDQGPDSLADYMFSITQATTAEHYIAILDHLIGKHSYMVGTLFGRRLNN